MTTHPGGVTKEARQTSKEMQGSLASVKLSVHEFTVTKSLGKNGMYGRVARFKPLLTNNILAYLSLAKKHFDDSPSQDVCGNILWNQK